MEDRKIELRMGKGNRKDLKTSMVLNKCGESFLKLQSEWNVPMWHPHDLDQQEAVALVPRDIIPSILQPVGWTTHPSASWRLNGPMRSARTGSHDKKDSAHFQSLMDPGQVSWWTDGLCKWPTESHRWGTPNSWMVCFMENPYEQMDDDYRRTSPILENPHMGKTWKNQLPTRGFRVSWNLQQAHGLRGPQLTESPS